METVSIVLLIILLSTIFNVISGIALFYIIEKRVSLSLLLCIVFYGVLYNVFLTLGVICVFFIVAFLAFITGESITEVIKNA